MKLIKAQIKNFKSIEDSGEFKIETDGNITCFVGKNESGKTNLLQALYRLNPVFDSPESKLDRDSDYPRRFLSDYNDRHPNGKAPAITTWWEIEDHEVTEIEETLGSEALKSREIQISRTYEDNNQKWSISFNEKSIITHFLKANTLNEEELNNLKNANSGKCQ